MADRLERLTNLVANLLETRRLLTLEEIVERVPGYPPDKLAYRRQFERDKETLREIGVPISVEALSAFDEGTGYRIKPSEYYLPEIDLDEDERVALHVAVSAVQVEGAEGTEAIWKLGGAQRGDAVPALAAMPFVPALTELFEAYSQRATATFLYRGEERTLDCHGILLRGGRWYVIGHDHARDATRSFRVDRIEGAVEVGGPGSFELPSGFDPASALSDRPWEYGEDAGVAPITAEVMVDSTHAAFVIQQLGETAVVRRESDGSAVVALQVASPSAFRSFVLGLLDRVEVLSPPELRADVTTWLEGMVR